MDIVDTEFLVDTESSSESSSSSTSSDSEFWISSGEEGPSTLQQALFHRKKKHRVLHFVRDVVHKYSHEEFRRNFRVNKDTATKLSEQFSTSRHFRRRKNCGGRREISPETQILAFLWFAGNKDSYREVSNIFGFTLSTAYRSLASVLDFMFDISKEHIKFPRTADEKNRIATTFEQIGGLKNVIGCIDGCYIYIKKPVGKIRSTYVNRHNLISLTLQGICDPEKRFTDVFIGSPSRIHDSRIFSLSFISKDLPEVCGSQYHLLGDKAYPLREYLLTPYKDYGSLTRQQTKYNKMHSRIRVKIENSFGLLKQRFRQLMRLDFFTVEKMCNFVLACCVVHNLCITEGDLGEDFEDEEVEHNAEDEEASDYRANLSEMVLSHLGELKRDKIADSL